MSKKLENKEEQTEPELYTVLCAGREYKTKFKEGDRVEKGSYIKVMIIEGVDDFLTSALKELHWQVVDEDFVVGKNKSTHAEPVSDNEIEPCT